MELNLSGKRVLVTGASSGLGAAAAMALATEGAEVTIVARNADKLEATATEIRSKTDQTPKYIVADISTESGIKTILSQVSEIDIFISNGGGPPHGQVTDHDDNIWSGAADLILNSAIRLTKGVIEGMIKRGWGRLVYITSVGVLQPIDDLVLSNTYRSAVTAFCKTVSNNYAKHGITANTVCPGFTATERLTELAESRAQNAGVSVDEIFKQFSSAIPVGRIAQPDELANLITFLASDKAAYITGTSIPVDGGYVRGLI